MRVFPCVLCFSKKNQFCYHGFADFPRRSFLSLFHFLFLIEKFIFIFLFLHFFSFHFCTFFLIYHCMFYVFSIFVGDFFYFCPTTLFSSSFFFLFCGYCRGAPPCGLQQNRTNNKQVLNLFYQIAFGLLLSLFVTYFSLVFFVMSFNCSFILPMFRALPTQSLCSTLRTRSLDGFDTPAH